jgi:hypothetical protein
MFAGRIVIFLFLIFCNNIFASMHGYERGGIVASCDDTLNIEAKEVDLTYAIFLNTENPNFNRDKRIFKKERIIVNVNDDGTRTISKNISCKNFRERIVTVYDKKDSLLFFKHYKWKDKMLIRTIDDGIVRNIIPGKTCCDFTIIEPSGDSISFNLNHKKKLGDSIKIRSRGQFLAYMSGDQRRKRFEAGKHDAIIYHWQLYCKDYYETEELIRGSHRLDMEDEQEIAMKDDYASPYKYYAIISICIIAASIVAIRKKWRTKK